MGRIFRRGKGRRLRFFTSDTHFGHENVIKYSRRPFANAAEMNREIVRRWNAVVGSNDVIFHLGDFSFLGSERTTDIVGALRGLIVLVRGNHDDRPERFFHTVMPHDRIVIRGATVRLSHYPYRGTEIPDDSRDYSDRQLENDGGWLLHGHVHEKWKVRDRMINVGVDQWNYTPVSEDEIANIIMKGSM